MSLRLGLIVVSVVLVAPLTARAHEDPIGCLDFGVAIDIDVTHSDGTGVTGSVTDCEQIAYRPTLINIGRGLSSFCAFSGGTFTFTTPDGIVHTVSADVPCIGGDTGLEGCDGTHEALVGDLIPYGVRAADVHDGQMTANAVYTGGVVHDSVSDTPGVFLSIPRSTPVRPCEVTTTVTTSSSTTSTTTTTTIPKSLCASLKVEAASQLGSALAECDAKALKFGTSVRQDCLDGAIAGFEKSWAMAEKRGDCLTTGDQETVKSLVVSCAAGLESALVP